MEIKRYKDFSSIKNGKIFESEDVYNDEPEEYILGALNKLQRRIYKMFSEEDRIEMPPSQQDVPIKVDNKIKIKDKDRSFEQMGLRLESSDIHKNSKTHKSLRVKFSDEVNYYDLYIKVDLEEGMSKKSNKSMSIDLVDKCFIKFKKIKIDGWSLEGTITKNDSIKDIDEDYLMKLKIELDEEFGDDEEFKIET